MTAFILSIVEIVSYNINIYGWPTVMVLTVFLLLIWNVLPAGYLLELVWLGKRRAVLATDPQYLETCYHTLFVMKSQIKKCSTHLSGSWCGTKMAQHHSLFMLHELSPPLVRLDYSFIYETFTMNRWMEWCIQKLLEYSHRKRYFVLKFVVIYPD